MLEAQGENKDINRIARSKYQLARVLQGLHDPTFERLKKEAIEISDTVDEIDLSDEDEFEDLVAYT